MNIVPGHAKVWSLWIVGCSAFVVWALTGRWLCVMGISMAFVGEFFGGHANHLHQHHDDVPPTWIERQMQRYWVLSIMTGGSLVLLGVVLAFCR